MSEAFHIVNTAFLDKGVMIVHDDQAFVQCLLDAESSLSYGANLQKRPCFTATLDGAFRSVNGH